MIQEISLQNFRCHEGLRLPTQKITLLLGPNSSGKSSAIHAILSILQSQSFPYKLTLNGKYVSLGDFEELVFRHDLERRVSVGAKIVSEGIPASFKAEYCHSRSSNHLELCHFTLVTDFLDLTLTKKKNYILKFSYNKEKDPIFGTMPVVMLKKIVQNTIKEIPDSAFGKKTDRDRFLKKLTRNIDVDITEGRIVAKKVEKIWKKLLEKGGFFSYTASSLLSQIVPKVDRNINYISSFRHNPERNYYIDYPSSIKVGKRGENAIFQLLNWYENKSKEYEILKEIGTHLGIFSDIKAVTKKGGQFEIKVKIGKQNIFNNIVDVGFGVSQFLPIMIADCQLKRNSTLFLSQPETHLHPSTQALLGEYFTKNAKKRNKRYVIETHSEYLINKLRLLVSKGELKEDEIVAYYFEEDGKGKGKGKGSRMYEIKFTKQGEIVNAPQGFFDTYMMDVLNIALEGAK